MSISLSFCIVVIATACASWAIAADVPAPPHATTEKTSPGDLVIDPINHSALHFEFLGKQYYVDPAGKADWAKMPKADAIFITHEHFDHLSPDVIAQIRKPDTLIIASTEEGRLWRSHQARRHQKGSRYHRKGDPRIQHLA